MKSVKPLLGYSFGFSLSTGLLFSMLDGTIQRIVPFESYQSEMFVASILFTISTILLLAVGSELRKIIGK